MPLSISGTRRRMVWKLLLVRVPAAFVVDGDVRNAAFDQPARHQAGLAESVAAVTVAQFVLLLRQIEHLAGIAQDQVVSLLLTLGGGGQFGVAGQDVGQRVQLVQQLAPARAGAGSEMPWLTTPSTANGRSGRIAARGEGLIARTQEAGLGKASLRLGQHDVRRNQSAIVRHCSP